MNRRRWFFVAGFVALGGAAAVAGVFLRSGLSSNRSAQGEPTALRPLEITVDVQGWKNTTKHSLHVSWTAQGGTASFSPCGKPVQTRSFSRAEADALWATIDRTRAFELGPQLHGSPDPTVATVELQGDGLTHAFLLHLTETNASSPQGEVFAVIDALARPDRTVNTNCWEY